MQFDSFASFIEINFILLYILTGNKTILVTPKRFLKNRKHFGFVFFDMRWALDCEQNIFAHLNGIFTLQIY